MPSKQIANWRVTPAQDMYGWYVYFDASRELLTLRDLTEDEISANLDKLSSVSGSIRSDYPEESDGCDGPGDSLQGLLF